MVEPSWVGRRVSVRRVLRHEQGRPQFGDVVGDLVDLDAGKAVVETRTGPVQVPLDAVAIARLVPPSTADELAIEAVAARGLRPAETAQVGGWLLRADGGLTRRANSVLPLRAPGMPLDDALEQARRWYADRDLPLQLQVPTEARRLLDAELGERGWPAEAPTQVLVLRLPDDIPGKYPAEIGLAAAPDADWLALYRSGAAVSEAGQALLARHDRVAFASVRRQGRTVAIGRGVVDDGWLGLMALEVAPEARRQGVGTAVVAALHRWGRSQGATRSYLQVTADNAPALELYQRLGYWVHHEYHYRVAP